MDSPIANCIGPDTQRSRAALPGRTARWAHPALGAVALGVLLLAGCAGEPPATTAAAPTPAPAPAPAMVPVPFNEAVRIAAQEVLTKAQLAPNTKFPLIVDPLVDGNTGIQTLTTAAVGETVVDMVRSGFPQLEVQPFSESAVAKLPLIMIGTFTPINLQGKADGEKDVYRVCFALADLKTGKIISKGMSRALPAGIDATPQPFYRDMPVWLRDSAIEGYIKTCQGTKAGDPIHPAYVDGILAAATINEAKLAYEGGRYKDALALYQAVLKNPAGRQGRVYGGMYLSNLKLGRKADSMKAFSELVAMGLAGDRLAIRFPFKPGATAFTGNEHPYQLWLAEIAKQSAAQSGCIEVGGHTTRGASEPLNERLSLQRAEFIRQKTSAIKPAFAKKSSAQGYGSRQTLIGTGKGDASDALDERIEFRKTGC